MGVSMNFIRFLSPSSFTFLWFYEFGEVGSHASIGGLCKLGPTNSDMTRHELLAGRASRGFLLNLEKMASYL
jgi:hypothetical protein